MQLRRDLAVQASVVGGAGRDVEFMTTTVLFALWVAEALGRVVSSGAHDVSLQGWSSRLLRAMVWSVRNETAGGVAAGEGHEDRAAWELLLVVQDAVPLFFELAGRDAERIQELAMGRARPSSGQLREARRALVEKVVPALNRQYASEN